MIIRFKLDLEGISTNGSIEFRPSLVRENPDDIVVEFTLFAEKPCNDFLVSYTSSAPVLLDLITLFCQTFSSEIVCHKDMKSLYDESEWVKEAGCVTRKEDVEFVILNDAVEALNNGFVINEVSCSFPCCNHNLSLSLPSCFFSIFLVLNLFLLTAGSTS